MSKLIPFTNTLMPNKLQGSIEIEGVDLIMQAQDLQDLQDQGCTYEVEDSSDGEANLMAVKRGKCIAAITIPKFMVRDGVGRLIQKAHQAMEIK